METVFPCAKKAVSSRRGSVFPACVERTEKQPIRDGTSIAMAPARHHAEPATAGYSRPSFMIRSLFVIHRLRVTSPELCIGDAAGIRFSLTCTSDRLGLIRGSPMLLLQPAPSQVPGRCLRPLGYVRSATSARLRPLDSGAHACSCRPTNHLALELSPSLTESRQSNGIRSFRRYRPEAMRVQTYDGLNPDTSESSSPGQNWKLVLLVRWPLR